MILYNLIYLDLILVEEITNKMKKKKMKYMKLMNLKMKMKKLILILLEEIIKMKKIRKKLNYVI